MKERTGEEAEKRRGTGGEENRKEGELHPLMRNPRS